MKQGLRLSWFADTLQNGCKRTIRFSAPFIVNNLRLAKRCVLRRDFGGLTNMGRHSGYQAGPWTFKVTEQEAELIEKYLARQQDRLRKFSGVPHVIDRNTWIRSVLMQEISK